MLKTIIAITFAVLVAKIFFMALGEWQKQKFEEYMREYIAENMPDKQTEKKGRGDI